MDEYNGDNLLNVLGILNVQLGDLNPNVVKAWFDTDDKAMKQMLNWMCTSLSQDNFLSAQECLEFSEIDEPLTDTNYEKELKNLDNTYPGILDLKSNTIEVELLEDEYELLNDENSQADELLQMHEEINIKLTSELSDLNTKHIESTLQCKETQDNCQKYSEELDELNEQCNENLVRYGNNLKDFEFGHCPKFLSNMDINELQESIDNVSSFLNVLLKNSFINATDVSVFERINDESIIDDAIGNTLMDIRERIHSSHLNYLAHKIEEENLKEVLNYLNKCNVDTILLLTESVYMQANIDSKEEQKRLMYGMIETVSNNFADLCINQPKLRFQKQELSDLEQKLNNLTTVMNCVVKLFSYYVVLYNLFVQEKKDIDCSDGFFRKVLSYCTKDLQNCSYRINKMDVIIKEHEIYKAQSLDEKCIFMQSIGKILSKNNDKALSSILEAVCEFKKELDSIEHDIFVKDFNTHRNFAREMQKNMDILQKFLVCEPTNRILCISPELCSAVKEINRLIKNQTKSIQQAMVISSDMKRVRNDKWKNYQRQLWIYFFTDHQKLFSILEQAKIEFNNKQDIK